jgi:hypothetical protein
VCNGLYRSERDRAWENVETERERVIDKGEKPDRRGEYWERHGVAISKIAKRIKVFQVNC